MNEALHDKLLVAKTELNKELVDIQNAIISINKLLNIETNAYARGPRRRKNGMAITLKAIQELGKGSIKDVSLKIQEIDPVLDENALMSKTATYLKRLYRYGDISCDETGKVKIYSLNQ